MGAAIPTGVKILTVVLVVQAAGLYSLSRPEDLPPMRPLQEFPAELGPWRLYHEAVIEERVQEVLRADEVISRTYVGPERSPASLFIAYFKTQRTGQAPHSPKNCLPGSGWVPTESEIARLRIPGRKQPIPVNRYLVERGDAKSLVFYWYQSRDRVVASEYWAKIYLVLDSLRYNRSDTALIRVTVPVWEGDVDSAAKTAEHLVGLIFSQVDQFPQFQALP